MWPKPQETTGLVTFTEETLNRELNFLCSVKLNFSEQFIPVKNCFEQSYPDRFTIGSAILE